MDFPQTMLYLKCTTHVQKTLGLTKANLSEPEPSEAPLGHWYVNRFDLARHKALVFMSEPTLLSFILYEGKKPLSPTTLPQMFLAGLSQLLLLRGFSQNVVEKAITPYHTGLFAKTDSRAALGSLNDIVARYQWSVECDGGLGSCDLTAIIMQITEAPQRRLDWDSAWDTTDAKLSALR